MDKLIEELTYFAYDGERDFFDITRSEAKSFLNELGKKDDEIERLNKENEELKKIQCTFLGTGCKAEMERLNNIINEFDKWLLGEQMMFYKGSDNEKLIRYGETKLKWLELKGDE